MAGPADLLVGETDGFAADFTYYVLPITGTLAATETGADTASISGGVEIEGAFAGIETGTDSAAFSIGHAPIIGSLAAAEVGADIAVFIGNLPITASLAATEIGADIATFMFAHSVPEANWTLAGSRVNFASLIGRPASTLLRGRM